MTALFEQTSLTSRVVDHMTTLITDGVWSPGTYLAPEGSLAQEFGVSRTVIRECVRVLASRGMLDVRQGRGTLVVSPTDWNVTESLALLVRADRASLYEWLEVRTMMEMECAHLAAQRATHEDRLALRTALERVEQANDDPVSYCDADIDLHLAIARAAHNSALVRLLHPVVQPLREQLKESSSLPLARTAATHEHRAIVERIIDGDPSGARAAMEAHLRRVASEIPIVLHEKNQSEEKEESSQAI